MPERLPCPLCAGTYKTLGSLRHHMHDIHRTKLSLIVGVRPREKHTHCPSGHEWTPENTYFNPSRPGARHCRACRRRWEEEKRQRPDDLPPAPLLSRWLELAKVGS